MLALAALYAHSEEAGPDPFPPTLRIRALLAALHAWSDGDRKPYAAYWQACLAAPGKEHPDSERYLRATTMRTHWCNIALTLGINAQAQDSMRRSGS